MDFDALPVNRNCEYKKPDKMAKRELGQSQECSMRKISASVTKSQTHVTHELVNHKAQPLKTMTDTSHKWVCTLPWGLWLWYIGSSVSVNATAINQAFHSSHDALLWVIKKWIITILGTSCWGRHQTVNRNWLHGLVTYNYLYSGLWSCADS